MEPMRYSIFTSFLLILLLAFNVNTVFSQSFSHTDSLENIILNTDNENIKLETYSKLVKSNDNVINDQGKRLLEKAIHYAEEVNNEYYIALFTIYQGEYYIQQGNYSESLERLNHATSIGKKIQSDTILTHAYIDIAIIYYYWNNYEKAEEYTLKTLKLADKSQILSYHSVIYNLLGAIYGEKKEPEKAKAYMKKYLKYGMEFKNSHYIISAYNNLALISNELGQIDSCMYFSRLALNMAESSNDINGQHTISNSLTRIYLSINEFDSAYYYLQKALQLKANSNSPMKVLFTYKYAYNYFKKVVQIDSALLYHEIYVTYKDSLFSKEQYVKISDLETKLETEKHQVIIKNLEIKNKINSILIYGISVVFILIFIIGFLIYRSTKLKNSLMKQNHELLEEKSIVLNTKVDFQQREMFNNASYIINQNKVYDGIINDLKSLNKLPKEEQYSSLTSLIHKIQKNKQGREKKEFEIRFKKSHEDFYKKIKESFPELTKKELDLCAFLNLNMSTKEIAALTNQSTRAIEVARSRLRKKLEIDSGINLSEYIRSIQL